MKFSYLNLCFVVLVDAYSVNWTNSSTNVAKEKVHYVFPSKPLNFSLQRKFRIISNKRSSPSATVDWDGTDVEEPDLDETSYEAHTQGHHYFAPTELPFTHKYSDQNSSKKFIETLDFSPEIHVHLNKDLRQNLGDVLDGDALDGDIGDDDDNDFVDFGDDDDSDDVVVVNSNKGYRAPAFLQLRRILRFVGRIIYFKIFLKMAILSFAMLFMPKMNLYHMFHMFSGYEKDAEKEEDYDNLLDEDDDDDDDDDDDGDHNIDFNFQPDIDFNNDFNLDGGNDDDDSDGDDTDDDLVLVGRRNVLWRGNRNRIRRVRRKRRRNRKRNGNRRTALVAGVKNGPKPRRRRPTRRRVVKKNKVQIVKA